MGRRGGKAFIMKKLLGLFLVILLLMACAGAVILAGLAFFMLRTTSSNALPRPPIELFEAPALEALATPTLAVPPPPSAPPGGSGGASGGFNGAFSGALTANNGSSAPATLTVTQSGDAVSGRLDIGNGLTIDGGICGVVAVPAGAQDAAGAVDPANPNRLATAVRVPVAGLDITAALVAEVAADGNTIAARVDIDLPFFCGRDASIDGLFNK